MREERGELLYATKYVETRVNLKDQSNRDWWQRKFVGQFYDEKPATRFRRFGTLSSAEKQNFLLQTHPPFLFLCYGSYKTPYMFNYIGI